LHLATPRFHSVWKTVQEKHDWTTALFNDMERGTVGLNLRMVYGMIRGG
jgi:hypothetical protein